MWARVKTGLLAFVVFAAVVGGCETANRMLPTPPSMDGSVEAYGARLFFQPDVTPMSPERFKRAIEVSAQYWGMSPDATAGWVVIQRNHDPWDLAGTWVWGVTLFDLRRVDFATPRPDCPELVFVHEWGHAGAALRGHDDPRFEDLAIYAFLVETKVCPKGL